MTLIAASVNVDCSLVFLVVAYTPQVDVSRNFSRNCLGPYSMRCKRLGQEGPDVNVGDEL